MYRNTVTTATLTTDAPAVKLKVVAQCLLRQILLSPVNGIKAEATPNTEMIIISNVDFLSLKALYNHGSVQNLKDRRHDLYEVVLKQKKHDIKAELKEALAVKV